MKGIDLSACWSRFRSRRGLRLLTLPAIAFAAFAFTGAVTRSAGLDAVIAAPDWLNGRVQAADLAGKVVIVDVFTFDCINCKHVVPNLQALHAHSAERDLAIIGVHAPETASERDRPNVVRELARQGIVWPVAIDNSFAVWHALNNEYWPTQYIFDRHGLLRRTVVGEGQDDAINSTVRLLIAEP